MRARAALLSVAPQPLSPSQLVPPPSRDGGADARGAAPATRGLRTVGRLGAVLIIAAAVAVAATTIVFVVSAPLAAHDGPPSLARPLAAAEATQDPAVGAIARWNAGRARHGNGRAPVAGRALRAHPSPRAVVRPPAWQLGSNCTPADPASAAARDTTAVSCLWYPAPTSGGAQCCCTVVVIAAAASARSAGRGVNATAALPQPYFSCLPSLVIAGAQKSGTTALYAHLLAHPALVAPEDKKELHWFDRFPDGVSVRRPSTASQAVAASQLPQALASSSARSSAPTRVEHGLVWYLTRFPSWPPAPRRRLLKPSSLGSEVSAVPERSAADGGSDVSPPAPPAPAWAVAHAAAALVLAAAAPALLMELGGAGGPLDPPNRVATTGSWLGDAASPVALRDAAGRALTTPDAVARAWCGFAASHIAYEATPSYVLSLSAPLLMRRMLPSALAVVLLRDPVARSYSEYQMKVRRVVEKAAPGALAGGGTIATALEGCAAAAIAGVGAASDGDDGAVIAHGAATLAATSQAEVEARLRRALRRCVGDSAALRRLRTPAALDNAAECFAARVAKPLAAIVWRDGGSGGDGGGGVKVVGGGSLRLPSDPISWSWVRSLVDARYLTHVGNESAAEAAAAADAAAGGDETTVGVVLRRVASSHAAVRYCFPVSGASTTVRRETVADTFVAAVSDEAKRIAACSAPVPAGAHLPAPAFDAVGAARWQLADETDTARKAAAALAAGAVVRSVTGRVVGHGDGSDATAAAAAAAAGGAAAAPPSRGRSSVVILGSSTQPADSATQSIGVPQAAPASASASAPAPCAVCGTDAAWNDLDAELRALWPSSAAAAALQDGNMTCWPRGTTSDISRDYLYRSMYAPQLLRMAAAMESDSVGVMFDTTLRADPAGAVTAVLGFLGLDAAHAGDAAAGSDVELARRIADELPGFQRSTGWRLASDYAPLTPRARAVLGRFFAPYDAALEAVLGVGVPWRQLEVADAA